MHWRVSGGILLVALLVAGGWVVVQNWLGGSRSPVSGRLNVVVTTPVLYSLTAKVLGDRGTLTNLVPPGASPENYALRPQDAEALERADVLVRIGLEFDRFLERTVTETQRRGAIVITASGGVPTRPLESHGHAEDADAHEEEEGAPDPHVWVDPLRAMTMVENIAAGLSAADPTGADVYKERAAAAAETLRRLDTEFRGRLATVRSRKFIAFHPAWGYFAERYGLQQAAVIEEIPGVEPTARALAELTALVERTGVQAIFTEPQFSPRIIEALARDLSLAVHEVNPEGGELVPDGYERFMRANVDVFVRALRE